MDRKKINLLIIAVVALTVVLMVILDVLPFSARGKGSTAMTGAVQGIAVDSRLTVELGGCSTCTMLDEAGVLGTNGLEAYANRFAQVREGQEFDYAVSGLGFEEVDLEVCCIEAGGCGPGERVFTVYADGVPLPELAGIDLAEGAGAGSPWQARAGGVRAPGGRVDISFKAETGLATASYIRFLAGNRSVLEFSTMESRHWVPEAMPLSYANGEGQDLSEVVLGRFGSRFCVNPVPQLRGWRQSSLGTWSDDLSEMVLAFRSEEGDIRCLPFTCRYPVFSSMDQESTLTGVVYHCSDPGLPFSANLYLEAPFYPEDPKVSCAPFFYLGIELVNPTGAPVKGDFLFARPHRYVSEQDRPGSLRGGLPGYRFGEWYDFSDASVASSASPDALRFDEAVALDDPAGVTWHYDGVEKAEAEWMWASPDGYPVTCGHKTFTWRPRGYSGFSWSFDLPAGASARRTVALASYRRDGVMEVMGDRGYHFIYNEPASGGFSSIEDVVGYAFGPERSSIEEKTAFFNGILSGPYASGLPESLGGLTALGLQSYIINTWWVADGEGRDWFAAWEGPPFYFLSTLDVEYNSAWFYLYFWPDLLKKQLRQWGAFEKEDGNGRCATHDIGSDNRIIGMTYPLFGMEVEENADYILLLYACWKQTGDTGLMRELFPRASAYLDYIVASDTDADGLPDLNADNSIDQAILAFISSRNQSYLGVKALAAAEAVKEMAQAQEQPPLETVEACRAQLQLINQTLREKMWAGDHFIVCNDPHWNQDEREAYSIYSANGLLWLLASGGESGLEPDNLDRMRADLAAADQATRREFGCVHTSGGDDSQWVSQNAWRDALGFYLGVDGWPEGEGERLDGYWRLEWWWARNMNGSYYDSVYYRDLPVPEGPKRGAYYCFNYLDQTLGYYSRGAVMLALPAALGRLRVDVARGAVEASPASLPGRVPVFACADWGSDDPGARIPVLVYGTDGTLQETVNAGLLP